MKRFMLLLLFCLGCPKSSVGPEKKEKEEAIKALIEDEDLFEDLPESGEEGEDEEI
tara:strand:- start:7434 stop:7601 length:168 start_codon:yes stop_codon:yes gene_type:complete